MKFIQELVGAFSLLAEEGITKLLGGNASRARHDTEPSFSTPQLTTKDEESLVRAKKKSLLNRLLRTLGIREVMNLVGTGLRGVSLKVESLLKPVRGPLSMGFRRWLREGVDPATEPRASSPHLFGRDHDGSLLTVFPREWGTTLVTTIEPPNAVPAEYYREFSREA
ncbi:hypothetical protein TWF481_000367 [Arthrobotrys musiformis]|uniref:Uncharacterized protein n=1 Tax=Arthrobotrys musiformis TaxID=47236 RepID=A0AAV9WMM2_9PEZI